ncbi:MAG: hypothetical protein C5B55_10770 [Blastocatellia bacterium]|nr:MAG: hypothetical protein C5B55_10770 [Blastocatellia bacterium]
MYSFCGKSFAVGASGYAMIRITAKNESAGTRLLLEGKLSGASVSELEKCWHTNLANWTALLVDLTNISFIDDVGKELLIKMSSKGTKLVSRSLMTKCLIEEINGTVDK